MKALGYFQDLFRCHVQEVLDDPSGVDKNQIKSMRLAAEDLHIDFDALILEEGTPFEIERLKRLEKLLNEE